MPAMSIFPPLAGSPTRNTLALATSDSLKPLASSTALSLVRESVVWASVLPAVGEPGMPETKKMVEPAETMAPALIGDLAADSGVAPGASTVLAGAARAAPAMARVRAAPAPAMRVLVIMKAPEGPVVRAHWPKPAARLGARRPRGARGPALPQI